MKNVNQSIHNNALEIELTTTHLPSHAHTYTYLALKINSKCFVVIGSWPHALTEHLNLSKIQLPVNVKRQCCRLCAPVASKWKRKESIHLIFIEVEYAEERLSKQDGKSLGCSLREHVWLLEYLILDGVEK